MIIMQNKSVLTDAPVVTVESTIAPSVEPVQFFSGIDMWDTYIPDHAAMIHLAEFSDIIESGHPNTMYVPAIKQLFKRGYRVDLDWRAEYGNVGCIAQPGSPNAWTYEDKDYRLKIYEPHEIKSNGQTITAYTPFPCRTYPSGYLESYKNSFVIKVSFRFEPDYINAIKACYVEIKNGLAVMKAKRQDKAPEIPKKDFRLEKKLNKLVHKYEHKHNK